MAKYVPGELQHCGICHYMRRHADNYTYCHRFPPTPREGVFAFPQVTHDDWCGEYQREPERRTT